VTTVILTAVRFARNARISRERQGLEVFPARQVQGAQDDEENLEPAFPLTTVLMAAVRFARPLAVAGRRFGQVVSGEKALACDVRRQLRLVVAGLMCCGKSPLCRMLAHLLGGTWVNQDEFSHRGKGAKRAFLEEVAQEAQDTKVPVLIVGKINTMRQHRREILDAMQRGVSGDVVFVQMVHPDDAPDRLDQMANLCKLRIQNRGEGHRTLLASNPKLHSILRMTAGGVEPMLADELCRFSARITVDVTQSPTASAMRVLADLDRDGFLGRFPLDRLVTQERLDDALTITKRVETQLACNGSPEPTSKRKAPVWYWTLDFDAEATATMRALWNAQSKASDTSALHESADMHVTLLFAGGASDSDISKRHSNLKGAAEVKQLRERLRHLEGHDIEVQVLGVIWDDRIAAAEITGLRDMCANAHPHVTLAHRSGAPPRLSNELLARNAANIDIKEGLGPWLAQLGLTEFEAQIRKWCKRHGAATADEITKNAADVAMALCEQDETIDDDQLAAIKQTLAHAAHGTIQKRGVAPFKVPLTLCGTIRGRLRGE